LIAKQAIEIGDLIFTMPYNYVISPIDEFPDQRYISQIIATKGIRGNAAETILFIIRIFLEKFYDYEGQEQWLKQFLDEMPKDRKTIL